LEPAACRKQKKNIENFAKTSKNNPRKCIKTNHAQHTITNGLRVWRRRGHVAQSIVVWCGHGAGVSIWCDHFFCKFSVLVKIGQKINRTSENLNKNTRISFNDTTILGATWWERHKCRAFENSKNDNQHKTARFYEIWRERISNLRAFALAENVHTNGKIERERTHF
jgi:hypothetical protein